MNRFLKIYANEDVEIKRKAALFFYVLLGTLGINLLLFATITISGGAVSLIMATGSLSVILIILMLLLEKGLFNLSSTLYSLSLLLAVGGGILFDRVQDLYEIHIFVAATLLLLISFSMISVSRTGAWLVAGGGFVLVYYHFFTVAVPGNGGISPHLIRNLVLASSFLLLGMIGTLTSQNLHNYFKTMILKDREEAEKMLRITEVYTKKSLTNIIRGGEDPTTYLPTGQKFCILFNDIRNFTALSEKMGPRDTVSFLNGYFDKMNVVIQENAGEIDKLIGDCIMASLQTPRDSIKAAIGIHAKLSQYNRDRLKWGKPLIRSGTGIAYGEVIQGNIGSLEKMDYTIIGEVVNSASRLENLTKYYWVNCLISEEIRDNLPPDCTEKIRHLDTVYLFGSSKPMRIYEVFSHEPPRIIEMKERMQPELEEAFEIYKTGYFEEARLRYEELIRQAGPHTYQPQTCADPALHFLASRCAILSQQKEAGLFSEEKWNGIYHFSQK